MRWLINDLRAWSLGIMAAMVGATVWNADGQVLGPLPLKAEHLGTEAHLLPEPLSSWPRELLELATAEELEAWAGTVRMAQSPVINALSGAESVASPAALVAAESGATLPAGLVQALARSLALPDEDAVIALAMAKADAAVRDPSEELQPGDRAAMSAHVARGLQAELAHQGARLAALPPRVPRPWVLVAGRGRASMGNTVDAELEAVTYQTLVAIAADEARAEGIDAEVLDLALPPGTWRPASETTRVAFGKTESFHEGWFDLKAWLHNAQADEALAVDPLHELGRLQAIGLLARAGLVQVVYAGHGHQVADPVAEAERFEAYTAEPLEAGDECQELVILRTHRRGPAVRLGLCLGARDPLVALSCSGALEGRAAPQHHAATLATLLDHGTAAPFRSIEPLAFRLFAPLQERMRQATTGPEVQALLADVVATGRGRLEQSTQATSAVRLADQAWLVETGGAATPPLLVLGPGVDTLSDELDAHLRLATTAWQRVHPATRTQAPQLRELVAPCGRGPDCGAVLEALDEALQARGGRLPLHADEAVAIEPGGRPALVVASPERTNAWVRLAVVAGPDEDEATWQGRAARLADQVRSRRVQGVLGG